MTNLPEHEVISVKEAVGLLQEAEEEWEEADRDVVEALGRLELGVRHVG